MKKTLYLFIFLLFTIISCNNSTENNNSQEEVDTIVNQNILTEETSIEIENNQTISEIVEEPLNPSVLQQYDEEIIFSFQTEKGKTMNILLHQEKYIWFIGC